MGTRNRNKLNGEKANEVMIASNDDDYCVLESIDGARIMKINDAKALIETIVVRHSAPRRTKVLSRNYPKKVRDKVSE